MRVPVSATGLVIGVESSHAVEPRSRPNRDRVLMDSSSNPDDRWLGSDGVVSLMLVAHSNRLLGALVELIAATTATPPVCSTAGGTDDGRMGTSLARIRAALRAGLDAGDDGC